MIDLVHSEISRVMQKYDGKCESATDKLAYAIKIYAEVKDMLARLNRVHIVPPHDLVIDATDNEFRLRFILKLDKKFFEEQSAKRT